MVDCCRGSTADYPERAGGYGILSRSNAPDSAVIYSPSAKDFDIEQYIAEAGGYLSRHVEQVDEKEMTGQKLSASGGENAINPKLLLAVLDYRSGWVHEDRYEMGETITAGLYAPTHQGCMVSCAGLPATDNCVLWVRDGRVTI